MTNTQKIVLALLAGIIFNFLFLGACEEVNPESDIRQGINRTWKVKEVKISLGATGLTTVYLIDEPNYIVNYASYRITFNEDNTYLKIGEYGMEQEGIWEFASNDTKILFDGGIDISDIALVLEFNPSSMVLQYEEENQKVGNMIRIFYLIPADD
jgi:hypothetical protein